MRQTCALANFAGFLCSGGKFLCRDRFSLLSAKLSAKSAGFESLKRHALPHPLNPLPADQVMRIADEHLPAIVGMLCEPPEAGK